MAHDKICLRTMQDYGARNRVLPAFFALGTLTGLRAGAVGASEIDGVSGVYAGDTPVAHRNLDLLMQMETDMRQGQLFASMDAINRKLGRGTVQMAAAVGLNHKQRQTRFRCPMVEG